MYRYPKSFIRVEVINQFHSQNFIEKYISNAKSFSVKLSRIQRPEFIL